MHSLLTMALYSSLEEKIQADEDRGRMYQAMIERHRRPLSVHRRVTDKGTIMRRTKDHETIIKASPSSHYGTYQHRTSISNQNRKMELELNSR